MEPSPRLFSTVFGLLLSGAIGSCDIFVYREVPPIIMDEFRDMPASFGPQLSGEGMKAYLVPGEPQNGCFAVTPPPVGIEGNWVVLLMRYGCSFEDKIRNAQAAGFDGVIVHNVKSDDLQSMSAKNSTGIIIPSVFVSETDGLILYNYSYTEHYFIVINGDEPFNINTRLLVPFAIVVMLCLFIMVVFLIVKCVRDRRRARRHCLPTSSLKKIPICKFAKGDPYDTCAICLDDYVEGDKLRVLPCAHAYHCKCIDPWLTKNRRVCPVCKRKVFASGERPNRRSNRDSEARSAHENQTDSDTDDDRAPLINSRSSEQSTQGGTFQRQRVNPFVRATRSIINERNAASESSEPRLAHSESCPDSSGVLRGGPFLTGVLNLRGDQFSSSRFDDDQPTYADNSANPSARSSTERSKARSDRQTSGENNPTRSRRNFNRPSRNRKRRSSDTTQASSNSNRSQPQPSGSVNVESDLENPSSDAHNQNEQGMIGVAALPNVEIQGEPQQSRRNDFVI